MEIKTKFSVGDTVFAVKADKESSNIVTGKVTTINAHRSKVLNYTYYVLDAADDIYYESSLYATKEELIEHLLSTIKTEEEKTCTTN